MVCVGVGERAALTRKIDLTEAGLSLLGHMHIVKFLCVFRLHGEIHTLS